jgi:outer membrane protein TolC
MSRRRAFIAAGVAALALAACDSPYRDQGILSKDVSDRISRIDGADLAALGEAGPLPPVNVAPPTPEELAGLEPGQRKQAVDLAEVRAAVLEHNLGIKVVRIDPAIANERVARERAKFEWTFGVIADGGRDVNFEPPLQQELWNGSVRPNLNVPLADGGQLDVDWRLLYFKDQLNSLVNQDNDGYQSVPRVSLTQPLLRGGGRLVNESSILVAEFGQRRVEARTRMLVHNLLVDAERSYWRAFGASRSFDIAIESYRRAVEQVTVAERLADAKQAAATEVVKAKYLAVSQIDEVISASEQLRSRSRQLKQAMNRPDLPLDDSVVVSFTSSPELVQYRFVPQTVLDTALRRRTELMEAELAIAESTLGIQVAQNGLLPKLDVFGTAAPVGFGQTMGRAISGSGTDGTTVMSFSTGVRLQVPLGNEAAKADLRSALYQRLKELATAQDRRLTITREVHDAVSRTRTGWQSVLATRQGVALASRAYEGVRTLWERRAATITDLTQSLLQLAQSQRSEANATVNYQLALLDLADATGMVPGRAGLSIDSDIALPAPESGDPGADPDAFLRVPALLQAQRQASGELPAPPTASPLVQPSASSSQPSPSISASR